MADGTAIEWCDATINAISGCLPASPGCTNCFASTAGQRRRPNHPVNGLTRPAKADDPASHHVWTGAIRLNEEWLVKPLRWSRPRRIFWNAHGDPFFERVPYEWVDRELAIAALTPHHVHMLLTKRTARMRRYFAMPGTPERILEAAKALPAPFGRLPDRWQWPLPNVWLGVSVEDQPRADERREDVRHTPAAVKFVSYEPALGPVDWSGWEFVDQIIGGGESGLNARPAHPAWFQATNAFCASNGIAYFHKQWGEWAPVSHMSDETIDACYWPAPEGDPEATRRCKVDQCVLHRDGQRFDGEAMFRRPAFEQGAGAMTMFRIGKRRAGRLLDGVEHSAFPEPRHGL
ncbi:MAG: hypothetical protein ABT11_04240 [Novosphingobium sp. SCN 66-18]|nr:MAG: hypothetical protein ABT11_04240 [Novosphingobium sp. SCN 66-18]